MKIVKVVCINSTGYIYSTVTETFEVEVEDNITEEQMEKIAKGYYDDFMSQFDTGFSFEL